MATCKELHQDYTRLSNWFKTHKSLEGKPEYDKAVEQEINIIKSAQNKKCSWVAALARRRTGGKTSGTLKKKSKK